MKKVWAKKSPFRYIYNHINEDLQEKMVFLGGPRQVGKTTLATHFLPAQSIYIWLVNEELCVIECLTASCTA